MIIDCIGDLHGHYPSLPGGDLLILAGDYTGRDEIKQWSQFFSWLKKQKYRKKIIISGNHDNFLYKSFPKNQKEADEVKEVQEFLKDDPDLGEIDFEYLCDSGTEFEGLKVWGTPWSLLFDGVNPKCTAFMGTEDQLKEKYDLIPDDIDIIISHTPPYGILDKSIHREHCGSLELLRAIIRVNPRYVVCGHIHENGSKKFEIYNTQMINCSYVNERYQPVNKPMRIQL